MLKLLKAIIRSYRASRIKIDLQKDPRESRIFHSYYRSLWHVKDKYLRERLAAGLTWERLKELDRREREMKED